MLELDLDPMRGHWFQLLLSGVYALPINYTLHALTTACTVYVWKHMRVQYCIASQAGRPYPMVNAHGVCVFQTLSSLDCVTGLTKYLSRHILVVQMVQWMQREVLSLT